MELETGDYHRAHSAFVMASVRNANLSDLPAQLALTKSLTDLDPTVRQLSSSEKYRRSLNILQMARDSYQRCLDSPVGVSASELPPLLEQADSFLHAESPAQPTNELAETILDLAQSIWQARKKACGSSASPASDELRLIMEKLSQ